LVRGLEKECQQVRGLEREVGSRERVKVSKWEKIWEVLDLGLLHFGY
jgi:hypothetical protein